MVSRYDNVEEFANNNQIYKTILKDRGVKQIVQYGTRNLKFPTGEQITELNILSHTWKYGDRYYRLAHEHYGDPNLWWVIAFFNQKPTESNFAFGDLVFIPHPLERVLNFYGA
jgi:nucleoid-associated protein YgaU